MRLMNLKIYCDLLVSDGWQERKERILDKIRQNKLQPTVYVITLAQGEQNQLEFYSSVLLKQHVFDHCDLFLVGLADGYDDAVRMIEELTRATYAATGTADIKTYILNNQKNHEKEEQ